MEVILNILRMSHVPARFADLKQICPVLRAVCCCILASIVAAQDNTRVTDTVDLPVARLARLARKSTFVLPPEILHSTMHVAMAIGAARHTLALPLGRLAQFLEKGTTYVLVSLICIPAISFFCSGGCINSIDLQGRLKQNGNRPTASMPDRGRAKQ
eukprot:5385329-Amphidinium_carterae.1